MSRPVFRFAPSPNGPLHAGHAFSALLNADAAARCGGRFLVRIEDIDRARCTPEKERAALADLAWLGFAWEEPVRRQSEHFTLYAQALGRLETMGLVYRCFATRGEIARAADGRADPDGAPLYPGLWREPSPQRVATAMSEGRTYAWRLDMDRALAMALKPLTWMESGRGPAGETGSIIADPAAWGDVILARKDTPTSYHLAVVVDDAAQDVTHVVRGQDLFYATAVHVLLQTLLGLPRPRYHHHRLILGADGRKLAKSHGSPSLADMRASGATSQDVRDAIEWNTVEDRVPVEDI